MDIVILDIAYKHGITEANISYCLSHFNNDIMLNDIMLNYPPMKCLFVGFDCTRMGMNYDEIDVDKIVNEVSAAVAQGNYRKATKKSMEVRLAALALLVKNMQREMLDNRVVQNEKELARACRRQF